MSSVEVTNTKTLQQIIDETSERAQERKTGELDKDAFINLLVTQLRYQDPLNPVNDKEFIGQMAQFSALEQMQNLNASFSSTKAFSLIGKRIRANVIDNATKGTRIVEGNVSAVKIVSTAPTPNPNPTCMGFVPPLPVVESGAPAPLNVWLKIS
jgi:flagellar basal-body rod modification protein FlgD